jgi:hypothetical protein
MCLVLPILAPKTYTHKNNDKQEQDRTHRNNNKHEQDRTHTKIRGARPLELHITSPPQKTRE